MTKLTKSERDPHRGGAEGMKTKPKNAFEVARDAQMQIDRGISSREDLLTALAAQFECADKIDALCQHVTELATLESQLSKLAADYAASHPEAMDTPLAPVRPNISQGVVRTRNVTYTLTETRGEKLTRLWSRRIVGKTAVL